MREIKFRAWDKSVNKMQFPNGITPKELAEEEFYPLGFLNEIIWMQYTGLKDKNDKEIYEGDIFNSLHDFGPGGWLERQGVVEFNLMNGYGWNYWDLDSLEIIGNIYENPELITQGEGDK